MNVEVVAIGSELLLGQIVDTNSSWIGQELAAAGLDSYHQTKVGDNAGRMKSVLELALSRSDAVICCGGLGPTHDDITREVIADIMGVELKLDKQLVTKIEEMFTSRGRVMSPTNLSQAMVPVGASIVSEQPGTAAGLICPVGGDKVIYAVPGVPYEMKEMITGTILPDLIARSGESAVIRSRTLRTWGMSESGLAELLADYIEGLDVSNADEAANETGTATLAFNASGVEGLKVRITTKAADEAAAIAVLDTKEAELRAILGDLVFGVDGENMEVAIVSLLAEKGLTVAVAESVTGGYIAGRVCAVPGASEVFRGGVVAYNNQVKQSLLGVEDGPVVTEEAAVAMAYGVRDSLGSDIGLASTGVAGPEEMEGRSVGTVCIAVASSDGAIATTLQLPGDRERIRQFSTISLLNLLRQVLRQAPVLEN